MSTKFTCVAYPFLRVLIERSAAVMGGDKVAEFAFGNFETDDAKTIEILRRTPFVYEDAKLNLNTVPVELNEDNHLTPETKARMTAGHGVKTK